MQIVDRRLQKVAVVEVKLFGSFVATVDQHGGGPDAAAEMERPDECIAKQSGAEAFTREGQVDREPREKDARNLRRTSLGDSWRSLVASNGCHRDRVEASNLIPEAGDVGRRVVRRLVLPRKAGEPIVKFVGPAVERIPIVVLQELSRGAEARHASSENTV